MMAKITVNEIVRKFIESVLWYSSGQLIINYIELNYYQMDPDSEHTTKEIWNCVLPTRHSPHTPYLISPGLNKFSRGCMTTDSDLWHIAKEMYNQAQNRPQHLSAIWFLGRLHEFKGLTPSRTHVTTRRNITKAGKQPRQPTTAIEINNNGGRYIYHESKWHVQRAGHCVWWHSGICYNTNLVYQQDRYPI